MSGGLIQIPIYSQEGMFCKQEWSTDAYSSLFVTIHYTLLFVGHPISKLESILMTITLNQTTTGQTLWRSVNLETDITILVVTLLKLT